MNRCRLSNPSVVAIMLLGVVQTQAQESDPAEVVTQREVRYYSEHVACFGRIYFPADFSADGQTPGIVLAGGWTATADSLAPYASAFAAAGLVAMAIDYRGWGNSGGFVRLAESIKTDDRLRFMPATARVQIKRHRILPEAQIEDIRNAISYLQGESGVAKNSIGLWGTGYGGGHVISIAARDARLKAAVCQLPVIAGKDSQQAAFSLNGEMLQDAVRRARTGRGGTMETGQSRTFTVDLETRQAVAEYQPFHSLKSIPSELPILFITVEGDDSVNNPDDSIAASTALAEQGNETKVVKIAGVKRSDTSSAEGIRASARASANWFRQHL